jgi:tetratricopeptide (TPR) repeat protein
MTFDDIEIDRERFELRKAGAAVAVEPKVFDLICYLVENAGRLVSKDDLIANVWNGRIVSDAALSTAIKFARRALGDETLADSRIKTVRGRGFRFDLPDGLPPAPLVAGASQEPHVFVQPAFVVLSPRGLAQGLDGEALQRRISTAMAGLPFLTSIAPMVARRLSQTDPDQIAARFGPGYALDIQGRADGLDFLLYATETGQTLWSHGLDGAFSDADRVAAAILVHLEPQLVGAIQKSLAMAPHINEPRALTMKALGTMSLNGWNARSFVEAEALLRQALDHAPDLSHARAALALVMALGERVGLVEPDKARRGEAVRHAEKAIELDPSAPGILGLAGCALVDTGQVLRGKAVLERSLTLDPNNAQALAAMGTVRLQDREFDAAVDLLTRAVGISPHDGRIAVWGSMLAIGCMMAGDLDRAVVEAERAVAADDRTHLSRIVLAAIALAKGDKRAARAAFDDARRVTPDLNETQIAAVVGRTAAGDLAAAFLG